MNTVIIAVYIWGAIGLLTAVIFSFLIIKSIGFRTLFALFKAKMKQKKGWGLVRVYRKTASPVLIPTKLNEDKIEPFGKGKGAYIYKQHCVFPSEFAGIPTLSYREDDSEPIDPRTGLQTVSSPMVYENIVSKALKAENSYSNSIYDFFINHWWKFFLFGMLIVGPITFIAMNLNDTAAQCVAEGSKQVIINGTQVGK